MSPQPRSVVLPALIGEPREDIGGIAAYVIALEKHLRNRGVDVTLLGYGAESGSKGFQSILKRERPRGRDFTFALWKRRKQWSFSDDTVIHVQRPDQALGFSGGNWPLVVSIHGCHRRSVHVRQGILAGMVYQKLQSRIADRADAFIFETHEDMDHYLKRIPVVKDKAHFVPIGIDRDLFSPGDQQEARRALGLPETGRAIVYLGRLEKEKNVGSLIRAVHELPDTELWITGKGKEEARLRSEAGAQVRFLGFLPGEQIPVLLRAGDVLALASDHEGLATVVLQAWACGRPVVVPPVGDFPRLLEDGGGVLAADNRPPQMIRALKQMFTMLQDAGKGTLENGFRMKSKPYDWEHITDQVCGVYRAAAARRTGIQAGTSMTGTGS